jgi:hypothetical protein
MCLLAFQFRSQKEEMDYSYMLYCLELGSARIFHGYP